MRLIRSNWQHTALNNRLRRSREDEIVYGESWQDDTTVGNKSDVIYRAIYSRFRDLCEQWRKKGQIWTDQRGTVVINCCFIHTIWILGDIDLCHDRSCQPSKEVDEVCTRSQNGVFDIHYGSEIGLENEKAYWSCYHGFWCWIVVYSRLNTDTSGLEQTLVACYNMSMGFWILFLATGLMGNYS